MTTPWAVLCVGGFAGAFVAGFFGFGLAAAAGAFLLHVFDPKIALPLMMLCSVVAQTAGIICLRSAITMRPAIPFVVGGVAGLPVAIFLIQRIESQTFRFAFGAFLVLYATWTLLRLALPHIRRAGTATASATPVRIEDGPQALGISPPVVGFLAGIVGGMTAMPGAVVSVWADAKGLRKAQQRGFVQPFILMMQIGALALMTATPGLLTAQVVSLLGIALVPLLLGTWSVPLWPLQRRRIPGCGSGHRSLFRNQAPRTLKRSSERRRRLGTAAKPDPILSMTTGAA